MNKHTKQELTVHTILLSLFLIGVLFLFVTIGMNLLATKKSNNELEKELEVAMLRLEEVKEIHADIKEEVEQMKYEESRSLYCSLSSVQCNE